VKNLLKKYGHIWVLGYALIYLPWFHYLEVNVKGDYAIMHVTLDDLIPFNEYFVVPYVLWFVYMFAAFWYFFFTSKQEFYRMCTFLIAGMTISLLICTFFPNGTDLRVEVDPKKNIFCWLVNFIHRADTATNVFPSIHAYNSIGVHSAVINSQSLKKKKIVRRTSFLLMITICLSTVFLKQHSVVDVLGATILSLFMYSLVYGGEYAENRRTVHAKTTGWG
jgi:membrane-associated phospholipid phosphatase